MGQASCVGNASTRPANPRSAPKRAEVRRRVLSAIGLSGLAALGLSYWLTYEPAPAIRVRWRDDVTSARQAALERKYQLSNARAPQRRSIAYDLLDTRQKNIRALVLDPAVADTADVDREAFEVPFDRAYGDRWMWIAHRTPGLRDARVRWTLIVAFFAMAVAGLRSKSARGHKGAQEDS